MPSAYTQYLQMLVDAGITFQTWKLSGEEDENIRDGFTVVAGDGGGAEAVFDRYGCLVSIHGGIEQDVEQLTQ